jgi:restriction system-associated AAA family ATPase
MQNFYTVPESVLDLAMNGPKWINISDEFPKQDPNNLIFRIENVIIKKQNVRNPIKYKGLSDGEHQYLQVTGMLLMLEESGCLFLLDEPDTHFNPLWRSQLVSTMNKVITNTTNEEIKKRRLQEIFITTHSPFVLSDLKKKNVYIFQKKNEVVYFKQSPIETYGASTSIILDEIFGKEDSISEMARSELNVLIESVKTLDDIKNAINRLNLEFGESVEKFDFFSKLRKIKNELEKNNKN